MITLIFKILSYFDSTQIFPADDICSMDLNANSEMMIKIPSNDSINETNSPTLYIIIGSGCGIGIIMCIILILVIATCGLSVRSNIKKGLTP